MLATLSIVTLLVVLPVLVVSPVDQRKIRDVKIPPGVDGAAAPPGLFRIDFAKSALWNL